MKQKNLPVKMVGLFYRGLFILVLLIPRIVIYAESIRIKNFPHVKTAGEPENSGIVPEVKGMVTLRPRNLSLLVNPAGVSGGLSVA
jgi:hypothetical protein